jgi:hypothetical protein
MPNEKQVKSAGNANVLQGLRGILVIALAIGIPVYGVSLPMHKDFITQPEMLSYVLLFIAFSCSFIICQNPRLLAYLKPSGLSAWNLFCGQTLYGSLYVSAILLCKRTNLGLLDYDLWIYVGLLITALGAISFLRAARSGRLWPGLLLMAAGLSLTHLAWFPLLALPGLAVMAHWLRDVEAPTAAVEN